MGEVDIIIICYTLSKIHFKKNIARMDTQHTDVSLDLFYDNYNTRPENFKMRLSYEDNVVDNTNDRYNERELAIRLSNKSRCQKLRGYGVVCFSDRVRAASMGAPITTFQGETRSGHIDNLIRVELAIDMVPQNWSS